METTQQHIDQLITTIWHATEERSVTNVMVARVLDWLNRRAAQIREELEQGKIDNLKELERLQQTIKFFDNQLKGTTTLAGAAYDKAFDNSGKIIILSHWLNAIFKYLETGEWDFSIPNFYTLEIKESFEGSLSYGESKHFSCRVFRVWEDVTDRVKAWSITRDSGDAVDDAAWGMKQKVKDFKGEIDIAFTREENDLGNAERTIYTVTAILADNTAVAIEMTI